MNFQETVSGSLFHITDLPPEFLFSLLCNHMDGLFRTVKIHNFPVCNPVHSFRIPILEDLSFGICTGTQFIHNMIYILFFQRFDQKIKWMDMKKLHCILPKGGNIGDPYRSAMLFFANLFPYLYSIAFF